MKRENVYIVLIGMYMFIFSGMLLANGDYYDNGNETITDRSNNILWQKCSMGQKSTYCKGKAIKVKWDDAVHYCNNLSLGGRKNWRLPSIDELKSLLFDDKTMFFIDTNFFPNMPIESQAFYWSSSRYSKAPGFAWILEYMWGRSKGSSKLYHIHFVRCVTDL